MAEQPYYRVLDDGTSDSGAVIRDDAHSSHSVDDMEIGASTSDKSVHGEVDIGKENDVFMADNVVNGDSYAARTAGLREPPRRQFVHNNASNGIPDRPRSAFFTPSRFTSARSVFDALKLANIESHEIACMQRRMNSEVVITFKNPSTKEKFLRLNSLKVGSENFAVQDIDRPLTFLTIYDAPFELSDLAIIKRLTPYCEVLHYRRGRFSFCPGVCNGLRHYRVRVIKPIPSFLRFGKLMLFLKHDGQVPTCRRCNQPGHFSNQCAEKICFNCENLGHEAPNCPAPVLCSICKSDEHLGKQCPYSWYAPTTHRVPADESSLVDVGDDRASISSYGDLPQWVRDLELSEDENEENLDENLEENLEDDVISQSPSVVENIEIDQDSQEKHALDSQGFLQSSSLSVSDPVQRPSLPESASNISEENLPDLHNISAVTAIASDPVPVPDNTSAPEISPGTPTTSKSVSTNTSAIPVSLSKFRGRRAPAPLPEALNLLNRKATSPVLVTSRPKTTTGHNDNQNVDGSQDDAMDTSSTLKRKTASPKSMEKKGRKKGKK